jgi:ABC-type uncharacterized transport system ATPase subunit
MCSETVIYDLISDMHWFTHRYEGEDMVEFNLKAQRLNNEFDLIKTLQDFSFEISLRELFSSLGPNGAGKTIKFSARFSYGSLFLSVGNWRFRFE